MAVIATRGLSRRFGQRTAVDNVTMTVPERAVYGFLGRNGAGKTTTLKMLLGLLTPTAGSAFVCGFDAARRRIAAARNVGALLEAEGFYPNLSGRENLELTLILLDLPATEIDRVLEAVDMREHSERRVSDYSLGMRQRLGLARAMLGAPPVLVLDEPTNGLDPDGITEMRHFLRQLPDRTGATVILSSHLLSEIEQTATHVGIMDQGRLVLEGELASLKAGQAIEVELRVGDTRKAQDLLSIGAEAALQPTDQLVLRLAPGANSKQAVAQIARSLVGAGIDVFAITPRAPSLEAIYRRYATPHVSTTVEQEPA